VTKKEQDLNILANQSRIQGEKGQLHIFFENRYGHDLQRYPKTKKVMRKKTEPPTNLGYALLGAY